MLPLGFKWRNKIGTTETNIWLKMEEKAKNTTEHKKQKLGKPQFTPVPYLRCLSYSHSLTCCPFFPLKCTRNSTFVTPGTHWFNIGPVSICGIICQFFVILWSEMIQDNSKLACSIFTYWKHLHCIICAHSFEYYCRTQEIVCFKTFVWEKVVCLEQVE